MVKHPVWESILDDGADEVSFFPVVQLPVSDLGGRVVGTRVSLRNGNLVWAIVLNLDARNARLNRHFAILRMERDGKWFRLARYWDVDYARNGPEALAQFLGLAVDAVFPITYDVRNCVDGDPTALLDSVFVEPRERLSEEEIIRMAGT